MATGSANKKMLNEKRNSKIIAIMGGTFDPVHLGHISFARDVLEQTDAEVIVFMPAKLQPFKLDVKMSSFEDRYNMLLLACEELNESLAGNASKLPSQNEELPASQNIKIKRARVSSLENELESVSYTYRTLEEFRRRYMSINGDSRTSVQSDSGSIHQLSTVLHRIIKNGSSSQIATGSFPKIDGGSEIITELTENDMEYTESRNEGEKLYFITGADTFIKLDTWMAAEKLLTENAFAVGVRPGYPDDEIYEKKAEYEKLYGTEVKVIMNTPVDLSATRIRKTVAAYAVGAASQDKNAGASLAEDLPNIAEATDPAVDQNADEEGLKEMLKGMVTEKVAEYIIRGGLYRAD